LKACEPREKEEITGVRATAAMSIVSSLTDHTPFSAVNNSTDARIFILLSYFTLVPPTPTDKAIRGENDGKTFTIVEA
jgi:hypothetical protein